jgi:Rrf2 family protein
LKIGTRTRYGLRTLLEIAENEHTGGVFQKDISVQQSLSIKYLDQIIHGLKLSGLITNAKGKKSGYRLNRKAEDITLLDIHNALEPEIFLVECLSPECICERIENCPAHDIWGDLNRVVIEYMKNITLADVLHKKIS